MVAESANWIRAVREIGNTSTEEDHLRVINQYLQIALAIVIFILTFPTIYIAHKVTKDLGWGVYKKIGSSLEIEGMCILQPLLLYLDELFLTLILYNSNVRASTMAFTYVKGRLVLRVHIVHLAVAISKLFKLYR
jgi:hypothetical protein